MEICEGCSLTYNDFLDISENEEKLKDFLYRHGLLPRSKVCPASGSPMTLNEEKGLFRCKKRVIIVNSHNKRISKQCDTAVLQNKGTWFERCRLSKKLVCRFVAEWIFAKHGQQYVCDDYGLSSATVVDCRNYLREVCVHVVSSRIRKLGGPGKTVVIDEPKIGHRSITEEELLMGTGFLV